jgi:hypothetical protein
VEHIADRDTAGDEIVARRPMLETTRYRPWAEPGPADVMCVPNWTEHPEPGGVNWTTRKPLSKRKSASSRQPSFP